MCSFKVTVVVYTIYFLVYRNSQMSVSLKSSLLKPVLEGVDSVAPSFITVNVQPQSNRDCSFHSFILCFAIRRSFHQNLLLFREHWHIKVIGFVNKILFMKKQHLERYVNVISEKVPFCRTKGGILNPLFSHFCALFWI